MGFGSIGHRHVKNLLKYPDVEVIICTNKKSIDTEIEKSCKIVKSLESGIKETPDIAFITNVTSEHVSTAIKLAEHGINLFIEKPLSHSIDHIDELSEIIKKKKIKVMIGSNFRFHECLKKIKELLDENVIDEIISARVECGSYLPDWHPDEDYRSGYAAQKELGGGVVLTCIHEIDYLHWFLGQVDEVVSFSGKYSDLELNVDDLSTSTMFLNIGSNSCILLYMIINKQYPIIAYCSIIVSLELLLIYMKNTHGKLKKSSSQTNLLEMDTV